MDFEPELPKKKTFLDNRKRILFAWKKYIVSKLLNYHSFSKILEINCWIVKDFSHVFVIRFLSGKPTFYLTQKQKLLIITTSTLFENTVTRILNPILMKKIRNVTLYLEKKELITVVAKNSKQSIGKTKFIPVFFVSKRNTKKYSKSKPKKHVSTLKQNPNPENNWFRKRNKIETTASLQFRKRNPRFIQIWKFSKRFAHRWSA